MTQINKKKTIKKCWNFDLWRGMARLLPPPPPEPPLDFAVIAFAQPVPGNRGMLAQIGCVEIGTRCI